MSHTLLLAAFTTNEIIFLAIGFPLAIALYYYIGKNANDTPLGFVGALFLSFLISPILVAIIIYFLLKRK